MFVHNTNDSHKLDRSEDATDNRVNNIQVTQTVRSTAQGITITYSYIYLNIYFILNLQ